MPLQSPQDTVNSFIAAITAGQVDQALQHYEEGAVFVPEPGVVLAGHAEIRQGLAELVASGAAIRTVAHGILAGPDLALYQSIWCLSAPGPKGPTQELQATSADVLRRQPDGRWLIAIDNPWGAELVQRLDQNAAVSQVD